MPVQGSGAMRASRPKTSRRRAGGHHLGRRARAADGAGFQGDHPVGEAGGQVQLVDDERDGLALVAVERLQKLQHLQLWAMSR